MERKIYFILLNNNLFVSPMSIFELYVKIYKIMTNVQNLWQGKLDTDYIKILKGNIK